MASKRTGNTISLYCAYYRGKMVAGHWKQQAWSPASLETRCFGLRFVAWFGNVLGWTRWKWHHGAVGHQASRICESLQRICISMLFKAQPAIHLGFARSPWPSVREKMGSWLQVEIGFVMKSMSKSSQGYRLWSYPYNKHALLQQTTRKLLVIKAQMDGWKNRAAEE